MTKWVTHFFIFGYLCRTMKICPNALKLPNLVTLLRYQCDKMAKLSIQYLAICNNGNMSNSIKIGQILSHCSGTETSISSGEEEEMEEISMPTSRSVTFEDNLESKALAPKRAKPVKPTVQLTKPAKPKMSIEIVVSR